MEMIFFTINYMGEFETVSYNFIELADVSRQNKGRFYDTHMYRSQIHFSALWSVWLLFVDLLNFHLERVLHKLSFLGVLKSGTQYLSVASM